MSSLLLKVADPDARRLCLVRSEVYLLAGFREITKHFFIFTLVLDESRLFNYFALYHRYGIQPIIF